MSEEKVLLEEILWFLKSIDKKLALLVPKESFQQEQTAPSTYTLPDIKAEIERKRKELMDKFGTPGVSEQKLQELKRKMDLPK